MLAPFELPCLVCKFNYIFPSIYAYFYSSGNHFIHKLEHLDETCINLSLLFLKYINLKNSKIQTSDNLVLRWNPMISFILFFNTNHVMIFKKIVGYPWYPIRRWYTTELPLWLVICKFFSGQITECPTTNQRVRAYFWLTTFWLNIK